MQNVTGEVLEKIVAYFEKRYQIEGEGDEVKENAIRDELEAWDSEFLAGVDQTMLFGLITVRQSCVSKGHFFGSTIVEPFMLARTCLDHSSEPLDVTRSHITVATSTYCTLLDFTTHSSCPSALRATPEN